MSVGEKVVSVKQSVSHCYQDNGVIDIEVFMVRFAHAVVFSTVTLYSLVGKANVSEEHAASIFRIKDGGSMFLPNVSICLQDVIIQKNAILI
jgi:hypothetical protein